MINRKLNKVISILIAFSMLGHITIIHYQLNNTVVCYKDGGKINIEQKNTFSCCSDISETNEESNTVKIDNPDECKDIPLDELCFEENQFIPKKNITVYKLAIVNFLSGLTQSSEVKNYVFPKSNIKEIGLTISKTTVLQI